MEVSECDDVERKWLLDIRKLSLRFAGCGGKYKGQVQDGKLLSMRESASKSGEDDVICWAIYEVLSIQHCRWAYKWGIEVMELSVQVKRGGSSSGKGWAREMSMRYEFWSPRVCASVKELYTLKISSQYATRQCGKPKSIITIWGSLAIIGYQLWHLAIKLNESLFGVCKHMNTTFSNNY